MKDNQKLKMYDNILKLINYKFIVTNEDDGLVFTNLKEEEINAYLNSYEEGKLIKTGEKIYGCEIMDLDEFKVRIFRDKTSLNNLEQKVKQDALTNLYNRRGLLEKSALLLANRRKKHYALMADIDDFKKINDTYGHLFGDKVLKEISKIMCNSTRNEDIVCRYGGEEFCIILSCNNMDEAINIANKIKNLIENHQFTDGEYNLNSKKIDNNISVTMSFGVSIIDKSKKLSESIDNADKALYDAKSNGKNVVFEYIENIKQKVKTL